MHVGVLMRFPGYAYCSVDRDLLETDMALFDPDRLPGNGRAEGTPGGGKEGSARVER